MVKAWYDMHIQIQIQIYILFITYHTILTQKIKYINNQPPIISYNTTNYPPQNTHTHTWRMSNYKPIYPSERKEISILMWVYVLVTVYCRIHTICTNIIDVSTTSTSTSNSNSSVVCTGASMEYNRRIQSIWVVIIMIIIWMTYNPTTTTTLVSITEVTATIKKSLLILRIINKIRYRYPY